MELLWSPYHMMELDKDYAQHISCSPHPVQSHWDTDNQLHTVVYKELGLLPRMLVDMPCHIQYTPVPL